MRLLISAALAASCVSLAFADGKIPKSQFQADFFGEMARAFCTIQSVDAKARTVTVRLDRDNQMVVVPIRDDTELHFRDSWGELTDYFPGQHVMLFVYVDEDRKWTYPRAIQDDIHVSARHGWFAKITAIDPATRTYRTHREEKNQAGVVTKAEDKEYTYAPDVKVWKSEKPSGIEALRVGDEVIQQLVERGGTRVAVEILDRKGDDAVRAAQDTRHRKDQERLGLPAYVNDIEPLSGALTISIAWSGSDRARELKPGQLIAVTPTDGTRAFAAAISSIEGIDTRQRLQLVVNARVASRLSDGQSLRVFLPGTGPSVPTGRSAPPASAQP